MRKHRRGGKNGFTLSLEQMEPRVLLSTVTMLNDQFSASAMSSANWHINSWSNASFVGETAFATTPTGSLPKVLSGAASIKLDSFNPLAPGQSCYGTDVISNTTFTPTVGTTLDITVRAKLDTTAGGMVGGIFLYPSKVVTGINNEVDFELVSNQAANGQNLIETNVYSGQPLGIGNPLAVAIPNGGKLTDYHTYEIKLDPGVSVTWLIDGVVVRSESSFIPTVPMQLHFNAWAPDKYGWTDAFNAGMNPVTTASQNTRLSMSVDYVVVQAVQDPVKVKTVSVAVSSTSLYQNASQTGSGTIAATGYGNVQYNWVVQSPNGTITNVGSTFTATIKNGSVAIPKFTGLPTSIVGNYTAWVQVSSAGNVVQSNAVLYTVKAIPQSIAITGVPALGVWGTYLSGKVISANIADYKVLVYINVNGGWWTKSYWATPDTKINSNGTWSCLVTTGGIDQWATEYRAYLVPKSLTAPLAYGSWSLPSALTGYIYADFTR